MGSFPHPLGYKIASLTPGTEIIILQGEASPPAAQDTVDIIWQVDGFSALTAEGRILTCFNLSDLIFTDRHFDKYPISDEAKRVSLLADQIRAEQREVLGFSPFESKPDNFYPNPESEPE